jgi:hypothetical protein
VLTAQAPGVSRVIPAGHQYPSASYVAIGSLVLDNVSHGVLNRPAVFQSDIVPGPRPPFSPVNIKSALPETPRSISLEVPQGIVRLTIEIYYNMNMVETDM